MGFSTPAGMGLTVRENGEKLSKNVYKPLKMFLLIVYRH